MEDGLSRFGELLGGLARDVLAIPLVRFSVLVIVAYVILLWFAAAWWTMGDMRRRSDGLVAPYLAASVVILASPLLFPAAIVAYFVVRPPRTLQQQRWEGLEARFAALDTVARCSWCRRPVEDDWLRCPACRRRLAFECATCGRPVGVDWELCAWCGSEFTSGSGTPTAAVVDAPARAVPAAAGGGGGFSPRPSAAQPMSIVPGPHQRP